MHEPDDILHENAETYREKENDYGKSWTLGGEVLHLLAGGKPVTLETVDDFIAIGLFTRRLDKIIRAFNLEFLQDEDPAFESVVDSHADESTYAAMHASLLDGLGTIEYVREGDTDDETDYEYESASGVGLACSPEEYAELLGDAIEPEVYEEETHPEYDAAYERIRNGEY
jgi:hypothetical protein